MRRLALLSSLLGFVAVAACGGQIIESAPDGGAEPVTSVTSSPSDSDGATPPTGNTSGPFPVCPGQQPKAGYSCPTPNQGCAYVDVTTKACESWTCGSNHEWFSSTPAGC